MTRWLKSPWWLVLLFLAIFSYQAVHLAATNSTISDETAHIVAGYSYLKFHDLKLNPEHPPLAKQIAALPLLAMHLKSPAPSLWEEGEQWKLGRTFLYKLGNPAEKMLLAARGALIPIGCLLGILIFLWTRRLFGTASALLTLFTYSLFPDFIAHSSLVTTDCAAATFFFGTFYFLWRFEQSHRMKELFLTGIFGGLALVSKFSMMEILPLFYLYSFWMFWRQRTPLSKKALQQPSLALLIVVTLIAVLHRNSAMIFALPVLFFWVHRFRPDWKWVRSPRVFSALKTLLLLLSLSFLVIMIVYFEPAYWFHKFRPLKRFFRGWAIFSGHSVNGEHLSFLLGEVSTQGWFYYYLIAMLVKIPLALLFLMGWGSIHFFRTPTFRKNWPIFIPPLFFFFIASFINKVNIGVRHILPIYPFLMIWVGAGFHELIHSKNLIKKITVGMLCLFLGYGTIRAFPNYLSYFNELASLWGGRQNILSDSNISWGQDLRRLKAYLVAHPDIHPKLILHFNFPEEFQYYGLPFQENLADLKSQLPGTYVIDIFLYQRLIQDQEFAWLKNRKPDAEIGGSLWVFHLV